ncbi:hypothetical protein ACFLQR_01390 [Verrucomicrobiota bacterium]
MADKEKIRVTKLDAARAQMETAIRLYFTDGDPIAVHTLAAAAHQILHDISAKRSGPPSIREFQFIRPGCEAEWHRTVTDEENFFKHADRDPDRVLEFMPHKAPAFLIDGCQLYRSLTDDWPALFKLFTTWMALRNPKLIIPAPENEEFYRSFREHYGETDKLRFYQEMGPDRPRA